MDKLRTGVGNPDVVNEKVHSFEAGWRARFVDNRLQVLVDFFYNIYRDMIYFKTELAWDDMGVPDIPGSTFQYVNEATEIHVIGGEAEMVFHPTPDWTIWGNLGLRKVTQGENALLSSEPLLRTNLGFCWNPDPDTSGPTPVADLALHYVSSYKMPLPDPENPFEAPDRLPLGNNLLAIGRLGYRLGTGAAPGLEAGVTVRVPLGSPFREYAGSHLQWSRYSVTASDFGGEVLVRLVSFYLRGWF